MKIFHGCLLLPCLIDAAFNKFPELLVNNIVDYTDINCDKYLGGHDNEHYDSAADNRKLSNIRTEMRDVYPGLYAGDVWNNLFEMIYQNAKALIVVMDDNETGVHYETWIGYASHYFNNLVETNAFESSLLNDLLTTVQSRTYSRIAKYRANHELEEKYKKKFEVFKKEITGPMKLKIVQFDDVDEIEQETIAGTIIGMQTITNELNVQQSVTYSQSVTKSATRTEGESTTFAFEVSEEIDIEVDEDAFFFSSEFTSKTTFKTSLAATLSISEAFTQSNTKTVSYPLVAPPCSVVTGILSVSQTTIKVHFTKTFEIGGELYVTHGFLVSNGVEDEKFSTQYIGQSELCNPTEPDICNPSTINPEFIPQGDIEWTCRATRRGRACKAACVNGNVIEDFRVNCKRNVIGEFFWDKTNKDQELPSCV